MARNFGSRHRCALLPPQTWPTLKARFRNALFGLGAALRFAAWATAHKATTRINELTKRRTIQASRDLAASYSRRRELSFPHEHLREEPQ